MGSSGSKALGSLSSGASKLGSSLWAGGKSALNSQLGKGLLSAAKAGVLDLGTYGIGAGVSALKQSIANSLGQGTATSIGSSLGMIPAKSVGDVIAGSAKAAPDMEDMDTDDEMTGMEAIAEQQAMSRDRTTTANRVALFKPSNMLPVAGPDQQLLPGKRPKSIMNSSVYSCDPDYGRDIYTGDLFNEVDQPGPEVIRSNPGFPVAIGSYESDITQRAMPQDTQYRRGGQKMRVLEDENGNQEGYGLGALFDEDEEPAMARRRKKKSWRGE